ncbi:hypothetical protein Tco_0314042 [Tanacetum coccineum]
MTEPSLIDGKAASIHAIMNDLIKLGIGLLLSTLQLVNLFTWHAGNDLLLFKMSMMGQMSFFLGFTSSQSHQRYLLNQSKYAYEIVKKYSLNSTDYVDTPMIENKKLDKDLQGKQVDATLYHGMIGSLMYLTASRPDLNYVVCLCARYQAKPTEKHLQEDIDMSLTAYADADHAGCQDTRRSTSGSAQFLGDKLVSWLPKKQKSTAISSSMWKMDRWNSNLSD